MRVRQSGDSTGEATASVMTEFHDSRSAAQLLGDPSYGQNPQFSFLSVATDALRSNVPWSLMTAANMLNAHHQPWLLTRLFLLTKRLTLLRTARLPTSRPVLPMTRPQLRVPKITDGRMSLKYVSLLHTTRLPTSRPMLAIPCPQQHVSKIRCLQLIKG
jgi:hypothetical protein